MFAGGSQESSAPLNVIGVNAECWLLDFYSASSRLSANGHSSSIHWASQRKPVFLASSQTSLAAYLWLLSVQMVSPARKLTTRPARRIFTSCFSLDRRCI